MTRFGDFRPLCHEVPSYPWCNLFFRQLLHINGGSEALTGLSQPTSSAPVGVNPECGIAKAGQRLPGDSNASISNIAQIVASALSIFVMLALIFFTNRRKAAVGRVELRTFFIMYLLTLPFQLLTTGSVLEQGQTSLTVLTAIHSGLVAALFWALLANALVATQVVEDGTPSSLIPYFFFTVAIFAGTLYISLDTAYSWTNTFKSNPPADLHNIGLFVLQCIWPPVAAILYFGIMLYVVLGVLREVRPMWFFVLSFVLFVLSQLDFFLLNKVICKGANHRIDGSFVATILETGAVASLYFAWKSITEESWDDNDGYYYRN